VPRTPIAIATITGIGALAGLSGTNAALAHVPTAID